MKKTMMNKYEKFVNEVLEMARERDINVAVVTDERMGCSSSGSGDDPIAECYNAMIRVMKERRLEHEKLQRTYMFCNL